MFRHVVLFRVRDDAADPDVSAAIAELRAVGEDPGILSWDIAMSLDTRKGRVIVEDGTFVDRAAFDEWRGSDAHRAVGERMASISDWWVGDWERK
ncbi:sulfite reductase, beta subunit [Microbacterium testaceum]|uniref:Sulfite reductase, beta subunit n=1 Tax=Microbacterium testaceum TaxID=2033 RepID=A0A147EXE7_MICTE|nr:Dabb family protein [Microbacterium testaceum]KTR94669.1 sulfite reductase, beta subunit [Microbacterium testaceum]